MCEVTKECNHAGKFWVQRNSCNLVTCSQHLPGTIVRFRNMTVADSHPTYKIVAGSTITVKVKKMRADGRWAVWV